MQQLISEGNNLNQQPSTSPSNKNNPFTSFNLNLNQTEYLKEGSKYLKAAIWKYKNKASIIEKENKKLKK